MYRDRLLHHLHELVKLYPQSSNQAAVKTGLEYCQEILAKTESFEDIKLHEHKGYYSLTASTQNTKKPRLLLEAHLDVVSDPGSHECSLSEDGEILHGRGVYDMLFGIASYLSFIELHNSELDQLDIGLMITGDEELGGFNGAGYLVENGYAADICFLPDAGEGFGDLSISAKGAYNFDLIAKGKAHHGSRPWEGDGAANKLIHMLHDLMDLFDHSDHHNSTITVTRFDGGGAINKGPSKASAHLDIRYKDADDYMKIQKSVKNICNQYGGEIQNILQADNILIDTSNQEIQTFIKLYQKHANNKVSLSKAHGGSDARFFTQLDIPVIMIRPDGEGAHSDHESISVGSLCKFYELFEDFTLKTARIK